MSGPEFNQAVVERRLEELKCIAWQGFWLGGCVGTVVGAVLALILFHLKLS